MTTLTNPPRIICSDRVLFNSTINIILLVVFVFASYFSFSILVSSPPKLVVSARQAFEECCWDLKSQLQNLREDLDKAQGNHEEESKAKKELEQDLEVRVPSDLHQLVNC